MKNERRHPKNADRRVYEQAWDENVGFGRRRSDREAAVPRLSTARSGGIVILASAAGAIGAYLLYRKRNKS